MLQRCADNCSTNCAGELTQSNDFELGGFGYLGESLKPFFYLLRGERVQVRQFLFDGLALGRKLEIVVNDFSQQAGHEGQGQPLQRPDVIRDQLSGLWRIGLELLRLEIAWQHKRYKSSGIGLPCASEAEKSSMDPRVGTRSVDSMARSYTTPGRTPAPSAIIQVVRESASPVR